MRDDRERERPLMQLGSILPNVPAAMAKQRHLLLFGLSGKLIADQNIQGGKANKVRNASRAESIRT